MQCWNPSPSHYTHKGVNSTCSEHESKINESAIYSQTDQITNVHYLQVD